MTKAYTLYTSLEIKKGNHSVMWLPFFISIVAGYDYYKAKYLLKYFLGYEKLSYAHYGLKFSCGYAN